MVVFVGCRLFRLCSFVMCGIMIVYVCCGFLDSIMILVLLLLFVGVLLQNRLKLIMFSRLLCVFIRLRYYGCVSGMCVGGWQFSILLVFVRDSSQWCLLICMFRKFFVDDLVCVFCRWWVSIVWYLCRCWWEVRLVCCLFMFGLCLVLVFCCVWF